MSIGSVAQTATLTSLAFFLSSGLGPISSVSGLPSYGMHASHSVSYMEPWLQPCGKEVATTLSTESTRRRHSVHRTLKLVQTQLRYARNHFRKYLEDTHKIYSKVHKVLNTQYQLSWLPEDEYTWYASEIGCLEKGKKAERALPRLHDSLQRFAITFHHLRAFRLKSNINEDKTINRRNEIIDGMNKEILRMLCEVETAIQNLGLQRPLTHRSTLVTDSSNWASEGDLTLMIIQDSGVLRLYRSFLNNWTRALRNATATGPGTCDSTTLPPLTVYFKPKTQRQKNPAKKHPAKSPQAGKRPKARLAKVRKQQQRPNQSYRLLAQKARRLAKKKMLRKKQRKMT